MIIKRLNSIFHRHSRWLFGIFTVVIIVSFIGFTGQGSFFGFGPNSGGSTVVGTAFGDKVSYDELRTVAQGLQVCGHIGFPVGEARIEQQFVFLCMLRKAEKMGLAASDKEVAVALTKHPLLQTDGKFDAKKYRNLLSNLERSGIRKSDVENALRMLLVLEKLQNQVGSGIIVTPGEVADLYRQYNTRYELKIAEVEPGKPGKMAKSGAKKLSELDKAEGAAVLKYFNANRKNYVIPGWMTAMVVEFPHRLFAAEAAKKATEKELEKFYAANKSLFAGKDGKTPAFAAVRAKVRAEFVKLESADLALRAAEDFSLAAAEAAGNAEKSALKVAAFRSAADKLKLPVVETGKLAFNSAQVTAKISSPELVRELAAVAGNPVTKVVSGENGALVGFLRSRVENRPAELDEVLAKVRSDRVDAELLRKARQAAEEKYVALRKLPEAKRGAAFDSLTGVKFHPVAFTLSEPVPDARFQQAIMTALHLKVGEVAAPLPNLQLVRLVARRAPDFKNFKEKERQSYEMLLRMRKRQQTNMSFMEEINSRCRLDPALTAGER